MKIGWSGFAMMRGSLKTAIWAPVVPDAVPPVPPPGRTPNWVLVMNFASSQAASGFFVWDEMMMWSTIAWVPTMPAGPGGAIRFLTSNFPPILVGMLFVEE